MELGINKKDVDYFEDNAGVEPVTDDVENLPMGIVTVDYEQLLSICESAIKLKDKVKKLQDENAKAEEELNFYKKLKEQQSVVHSLDEIIEKLGK